MKTCILVYLAGQLLGSWCIVLISTVCLMGALIRVVIPVLAENRKLAHLPGPTCHRFISGHGDYMKQAVNSGRYSIMFDVWLDWAELYGPVFHYRHYHKHVIPLVHGPEPIKRVLHDPDNTRYIFKESLKFYMGHRMLGKNGMLLTPNNEAWRIKKVILRQFLNQREVANNEGNIMMILDRALANMAQGQLGATLGEQGAVDVDVLRLVQCITSDVMGQCLLNRDFGCSSAVPTDSSDIAEMSSQVARESFRMIADPTRKLPFRKLGSKKRTIGNILKIRRVARNIIEKGSPLTDKFLEVFDDIEDIIDDVNSILFAGQDTTSNTITYALANIAHDMEVNKWLRQEIAGCSSDPSWAEIARLPRLDAVVKETLRLYPSAPMTLRTLHKDHDIHGHKVPQGTCVWVSPYTAARSPKYWDSPTSFKPVRFINIGDLPKCQYFPFMAGPHECSGKHFAVMESKMVIFHILQRYHIELLDKTVPTPQMAITIHPSRRITIRFTRHLDLD